MTFTSEKGQKPKTLRLKPDQSTVQLIIHGQGVMLFRHTNPDKFCVFDLYNHDKTDGLRVELTEHVVLVSRISTGQSYIDLNNTSGLVTDSGAYYWCSLDAQNQALRCGVGEARMETAIYGFIMESSERVANKAFMESIETIQVAMDSDVQPIKLLRDPITCPIPALVKPMDELTMDQIASGSYLPKGVLPLVAQQLHDCIAGRQFTLDTDDFPDFVQAIEKSITSGWCYKRLQEKSHEFSKDKPNLDETYLRITLGQNNGESPGIPYVMEIWPVGHYSPVHNHSEAHAIIRVLHGTITVSQFPFLSPTVKPFAITDFHKDQITWISPTLNQTHQLRNLPGNAATCITIQCYLYDQKDNGHYDYFDYVDADGAIQQYEPDSDMDFVEFKKLMREEWGQRETSWWGRCFS